MNRHQAKLLHKQTEETDIELRKARDISHMRWAPVALHSPIGIGRQNRAAAQIEHAIDMP